MTVTELLIMLGVVLVVSLAAASMYVASFETWSQAGAKLALQRDADLAVCRIVDDVRSGSEVEVLGNGTILTITRQATSVGDSTVNAYAFLNGAIKDMHGNVVLDNVSTAIFESPDGERVRIGARLLDDNQSPQDYGDDSSMYIESLAVCRNLPDVD